MDATHTEAVGGDMHEQGDKPNEGFMGKGEIDIVSDDSIKASQVVKLEAFKQFVDLDDAQIALLAEAMVAYPHLWDVVEKFNEHFQAWMLRTLADMLFFLRNESAITVTCERKEDFDTLCDEAIQLGFERSWVEEMRQRVTVRDAGVDHALARLDELLHTHDQLTEELCKLKDEINSLEDFVDSHKKCYDFL